MEKILFESKDKVGKVTINNPTKMNCLDMEMLEAVASVLLDIKKSRSINVLVVQGAGDKAFSTGGNLNAFGKLKEFHEVKDWIKYGNEVFNLLDDMPIATIASIQGYAMGGGLELALACDLRTATENAVFSMPELNHGWVPGWGGLSRLRRLLGEAKAKEMIMLGEHLSANDALQFGLVNKVCKTNDMEKVIDDTALKLSKIDPFVMEMSKNALMDHGRTTWGNDLLYDALATYYSKI
jgi:enoyl-CoA hydratase/carnithine racemase